MRRLLVWTVAYLMAIYLTVIYGAPAAFFLFICFLLMMLLKVIFFHTKCDAALILSAVFLLLGMVNASYSGSDAKSDLLYYRGKTAEITARITDYPEPGEAFYSTNALVTSIDNKECKEKTLLRIYGDTADFSPGDIITASAKISRPTSSANIYDDYSIYLKSQKIYTITSVKSKEISLLYRDKPTISERFTILRGMLVLKIKALLPEGDSALICAMLIGDKSQLSQDMYDNFSKSGLSHILAVSGLHVTVITTIVLTLLMHFGFSRKTSYITVCLFIIIYVPLTGMSVSSMRAGFMMLLFILSHFLLRRTDPLTSLSASALIFTIINPFYAFSLSFMLSFGACLGIFVYSKGISELLKRVFSISYKDKFMNYLATSLATTFSAQIYIVPVMALYFGEISLWAVYANLIAIPLLIPLFCGSALMLIFSFFAMPIAKICSCFVLPFSRGLLLLSEFFADKTGGIISTQFTMSSFWLYMMLIFLLYLLTNTKNSYKKGESPDES